MRCFWKLSILVGVLGLSSLQAHAHSKPKVMTPEANSTVSAPDQVSVIFTEALEAKFSSLKLTDEKAAVVSKTASVLDPVDAKHLTLALPKLAPGVYHVHWVAAATDGHRSDGEYAFTVK